VIFRRILSTIKRIQRPVVRGTQRVLLHGALFLLYHTGFVLARLLMTVLARRLLYNRPPGRPAGDTYWREAVGYDLDGDRLTRQS
jgi:hypothetical protein